MPKISILSESLINKIAAGEVIERPASVVRELLDNSIDAGAKGIYLEILHGGKKLIKISDDGAGMDREDAMLCFERHATSKIKSEDDLFNVHTLGFRGEALSSIASVSKITLTTSDGKTTAGTKREIAGGEVKAVTDAPSAQGTTIEVRDIFYNTPARRKFLKSITTELSHMIEIVTQKAIAYPGILFALNHNGKEIFSVSPVKSLKERFVQLYGEELFDEFLEISTKGSGLEIYGFLSGVDFARANKAYQYVFVNKRAIKNPTVSHAVYASYDGLIPKDKHPAFFLFLDIDTERVDVNVHPAKREVRFESPQEIHRAVEYVVNRALNQKQNVSVSYPPSAEHVAFNTGQISKGKVQESLAVFEPQHIFFKLETAPSVPKYLYIGEPFVVVATGGGITIIDQHAAHERVLYEKFLKKTDIEVENLLLPVRVELPHKEFNIIVNNKDILHDFGFDIENFGANNIIIRTIPKALRKADMRGLFLDIASGILEAEEIGSKGSSEKGNLLHNIAARLACHKSVRGSEALNSEKLSSLIADLNKTDVPDKCPHGRPTRISFSIDDLRKMFKRI